MTTWRRVPSERPDGAVEVRPLGDNDNDATVALLTEATRLNVNWTGVERASAADVTSDPTLAHYTRLSPGRGDFGLVAEVDGRVVGVVWLLFLDSADPGYGYVADGVPELSLCVWPGYRGVGVGGLLLDTALTEARERGLRRISLSVEVDNPAERIYRARGFVEVGPHAPGTMACVLR